MEKVKVGIVGCGYIGRTHAMAFSYTPRVEIVAAADKNEERAKELAAKYKAKPYGDYTDMIDSEKLDAVSIALPSRLHAEATVYALKHGLHVLCEKPMAPSLEECDRMIKEARERSLNLMIGQSHRYWQLDREAKWIIDKGFIGEIIMLHNLTMTVIPERWGDDILMGTAVHFIDTIRWWVGSDVEIVYGKAGSYVSKYVDNAMAIFTFKNGVPASIGMLNTPGNDGPGFIRSYIYGSEGIVETDHYTEIYLQRKNGQRTLLHSIRSSGFDGPNRVKTFSLETTEFVNSILEGRDPAIPGEEGRKNIEIILAWMKSSETGEPVKLPLK